MTQTRRSLPASPRPLVASVARVRRWRTRSGSGSAAIAVAAAAFLLHQLMAWPPHEDETLALFVGRDSLAGVVEHVTRERGGAPLHFLVAWRSPISASGSAGCGSSRRRSRSRASRSSRCSAGGSPAAGRR